MKGKLFVVATPIGNLKDVTLRALEVLGSCDIIVCEDKRRTLKLLNRYGISKKLMAMYEGNEDEVVPKVVSLVTSGKTVCLVSDSGTPLISDPGYKLVKACREAGLEVLPIPGPSAVIAALSVAGLPTDRFAFFGFPPRRRGKRLELFKQASEFNGSVVFFISPHRFEEDIKDMLQVFGDRPACLCREMTKLHEEYVYSSLSQILHNYRPKGEMVLVIGKPLQQFL